MDVDNRRSASVKIGVSRKIVFRDGLRGFMFHLAFRLAILVSVQGGWFDDWKIKGGGAFLL